MNKKLLNFVLIFSIFFSMLFGIIFDQNISLANVADKPLYINLGKYKTVNGKKIGYAVGDPTTFGGNYIWEINQYNSNNVNDKVTNPRNLYCIKAEYGTSWTGVSGGENTIVKYNLSYDLEKQREDILGKLDSSNASSVVKNLLTPEKGAYKQVLWILDNAYIPGETNKSDYLKKLNVALADSEDEEITDDDIIAIQKMAIWYFTNYIIHDDITYTDSSRYKIYDKTGSDKNTGLWLNTTEDGWESQEMIGDRLVNEIRQEQTDDLYKNLIKAAQNGASEYDKGSKQVSIDTTNLTKISDNKYKVAIKKAGNYYVLGPIKLSGTNTTSSELTLKVTDKDGKEISGYKFSSSDGTEQNKTLKDYIGDSEGFYVKVPTSSGKTVKISLNITNSGTKKTLWLKGTETSSSITLDGEQPLVEISREKETIETEFTAEYTEFDLALRKYIVEVNGKKLADLNLPSRNPKVDVSSLKTGTTATYNHRKAPVEVKENDVVTYSITIYNEGDIDGYASKIIDQLPTNLITSPDNPSIITSIGKDGKAKNQYKITNGLPTASTTDAPANSIVFNIVTPAKSLKAYSETDGLDYETLTFKCIVKQEADSEKSKILTNVAWIADAKDSNGNSVTDRDSSPSSSPNVNRDNMENYTGNTSNKKDLEDDNNFYKGEQDDDDFEKLIIKPVKRQFDLELVKFIAAVSKDAKIDEGEYLTDTKKSDGIYTRAPKISIEQDESKQDTNRKIKCDWSPSNKEPLLVDPGDYVLYTIRVYNAGEVDGYASLIKDLLPVGLEFVETSDQNAEYYGIWNIDKMTDENGDEREVISTDHLAKGKGKELHSVQGDANYTANLLRALDDEKSVSDTQPRNPDYRDVQVLCRVKEQTNKILVNYAQISADTDKDGNEITDKDSTPDNLPKDGPHEDDEDLEKIKVRTPDKYSIVLVKEDKNGEQLNSTAEFEVTTNGKTETKKVTGRLTIAENVLVDADHLTDDVYVIKETKAPDDYCRFDGTITITVTKKQKADRTGYEKSMKYTVVDSKGNDITNKKDANVYLNEDGNIYVEVKNYEEEKYNLVLVKEDKNGEQLNSTTEFEVTTNGKTETKKVTGRLTIAENVLVDADHLTDDVYVIKETKAPDDYCRFDGTITITVTKKQKADRTGYEKSMKYTVVDSKGNDITNKKDANVYLNEDGNIYVEVKNYEEPEIHKGVKDVTNQDSGYDADEVHTWVIESDIPSNLNDYKLYDIIDDIDYRLKFEGIEKVIVKIGSTTLKEGTDYKISFVENADGVQNKTTSGKLTLLFLDTENGMNASTTLKNNQGKKIQVTFNTTFAKDENGNLLAGMGEQIPNQAKLEYINTSNDNKVTKESEKPEVHTGGVVLYKYYELKDEKHSLEGAKFGIYATEEDAKNNKNVIMTATSDKDGLIKFVGLKYGGDAKDSENNKQQDGTYKYDADKASTNYWIAEIEAPDGFEKYNNIIAVTINKDSYDEKKPVYEVKNNKLNFDLALRKFITKVQDTDVTTRIPQVKYENEQITYEHTKEPVVVHVNDVVIYTLRIFNEGNIDGYASEITDDIPDYLEYLPENETNTQYLWKMYDKDGNETQDVSKAEKVKTTYLSKDNEKTAGENLLKAFDGNVENISYKDIKIAFKVKDPNSNTYIITNHAQISDDSDKDGKPIEDIDSKPGEWNEGEDDQDVEHVKVEYFDLALLKYVTKAIVIENGQERITETGYNGLEDPEPVVKVEIKRNQLNNVIVKFAYGIKITNEGDIPGYAKEITDYIPAGLRFEASDNPEWKDEGNNVISTRQLEGTLLQPGESAVVEVVLTWINGADNLGEKTNTAEISEDYNDHGDVPDRDSTPDNQVPGEDDIDIAKVILTISTGIGQTFFGLTIGLLSTILIGIVLIKKFVL